jgi:hypothetical protein
VTGDLQLVGIAPIPFGSGTTVDCSAFVFVLEARIEPDDADADGVEDPLDNCPALANAGQSDGDADAIGDACDNCPAAFNPYQDDADGDGAGNVCEPLHVNFQPASAPVPAGYGKDSGLRFDPGRGWGWLDGASLQTRDRNILADQRLDTLVFTKPEERWVAVLPPGRYDIVLAIGDAAYAQGPQRLTLEDEVVFDQTNTAAGQSVFAELDATLVVDGRLAVALGGAAGNSTWNYIDAVELAERPFVSRSFNFQPPTSPQPLGFGVDTGAPYSPASGHGWDTTLQNRDRALLGDPVLDTLVFTSGAPASWRLDLPADYYRVQLAVGDAQYAQGPQTVVVEGEAWLADAWTAAGEFITASGSVLVLDGELTIAVGEADGSTTLVYVHAESLPRDADGDGVPNFNDNCLELSNPAQEDADSDGIGDACAVDGDSDGWSDVLDNCPAQPNPDQANSDGDPRGNVCDCAPADAAAYAPVVEVQQLTAAGAVTTTLGWSSQASQAGSGTRYDVVSVDLATLLGTASFQGATCLANDWAASSATDSRGLGPGAGFAYLVRAVNACGAGSYGDGTGTPDARDLLDAAGPCP